jgi:hypothetical protein
MERGRSVQLGSVKDYLKRSVKNLSFYCLAASLVLLDEAEHDSRRY